MSYGDGKYQSFAKPRLGARGKELDRIDEVLVPHRKWRDEVSSRGEGATFAATYDAGAQALAASHRLGVAHDEMIAWQKDPANITKFEELSIIQYRVPL